ncbi:MAG: mandelate racemase/muconate lactonizing enzyme family protein [Chloroflexota bacterium]
MTITGVEIFRVRLPVSVQQSETSGGFSFCTTLYRWVAPVSDGAESVVVRIEVASGVVGWGETVTYGAGRVVGALIEDILTPVLIGADAQHIAPMWERMYASTRHLPGALAAIAAVDMALWDIFGKQADVPVARLLGAQVRERVPLCATGFTAGSVDTILQQAQEATTAGFRTVAVPTAETEAANHDLFASLRELDISVAAVAQAPLDFAAARRLGRMLQQYGVRWLDVWLPSEQQHEASRLAAFLDLPLVSDKRLKTRWEFQRALTGDAFDIASPDLTLAGGISECRRIINLADAFGKPYRSAGVVGMGIGVAATLQLAAYVPNLMICEWPFALNAPPSKVITPGAIVDEGMAVLSDLPGLGIAVDEVVLRQWAVQ